jgi:hypothetical protein
MAKATRSQLLLVMGLLTIALMAPPIVLGMSGQFGLASVFVYGGIIGISAIFYDLRLALILSVIAGVAGTICTLLNPYPLAGAAFFGILTGACALTSRRGLHSPALMVPVFASFLLVAPPTVPPLSAIPTAFVAGAVLLVGGLWGTAITRVLLGHRLPSVDRKKLGPRGATAYGVIMGVVLGVAAWAVLSYAKFHEGAWLLLTLIILLQPSPHDTFTKSMQRLAGTLGGALIAVVLILINVEQTFALVIGGFLIFGALTVRYVLKRPYWEYVTVLTPAVILLSASGVDRVRVAEDRVGFTLIAAAVALLIALGVKAILVRRAPTTEST